MSAQSEISATMAACLAFAHEHGGKLIRFAGGYWAYDGVGRSRGAVPDEYFGASTVEALVRRGRLRYSQFRKGRRSGPFPVEAELVPT